MDTPDYTNEEWRAIDEAPHYAVSNFGRVKRTAPDNNGKGVGRVLAPCHQIGGYRKVGLWTNGKTVTRLVHRLACIAFHGPPPSPKHEAAHIDGVPHNNCVKNLRWVTPLENAADRIIHGTSAQPRGEDSKKSILTDEAVFIIRSTKRYNGVLADLAKRFGVAENTVMALRTRSSNKWAHVKPTRQQSTRPEIVGRNLL